MARYKRTILGTCCVPWNEDGSLAEAVFRDSIRALIQRGLPDLYIFGTAGEGFAVTDPLFDHITRVFAEEMADGGAAPMVGVISLSLPTIIERIERAGAIGIKHFQISLPSWGALNEREMFSFFAEVCGRFPEFQFLHYNLPRTKRLVMPEEYAALAVRHPNLVATKYGGSDLGMLSGLLRHAGELRHFFGDTSYAVGSLMGECGLLISIASTNLRRAWQYFEAGVTRDISTLFALRQELAGVHEALMKATGSAPRIDSAYDKVFSRMRDPNFPLRLLPPYEGTSEAEFQQYRAVLRAHYPMWLDDSPVA